MDQGSSELDHRGMENSCLVLRVTYSNRSHSRSNADTPVSNTDYDIWVHICTNKIVAAVLWSGRCYLGPTIPIIQFLTVVCETHYRPNSFLLGNNVPGELQPILTGKFTILQGPKCYTVDWKIF